MTGGSPKGLASRRVRGWGLGKKLTIRVLQIIVPTYLDLKSGIIAIDTIGTQEGIALQIKAAKAEYILALRNNYPGFG